MPSVYDHDVELMEAMTDCILVGFTATQAYEHLKGRYAATPEKVPSKRTLYRWYGRMLPAVPGQAWSFLNPEPWDAGPVLRVRAWLATKSQGKLTVSQQQAVLISRLSLVLLSVEPEWLYRLAMIYQGQETSGARDLDLMLSYRPWESLKLYYAYERLVALGVIGEEAGLPYGRCTILARRLMSGSVLDEWQEAEARRETLEHDAREAARDLLRVPVTNTLDRERELSPEEEDPGTW